MNRPTFSPARSPRLAAAVVIAALAVVASASPGQTRPGPPPERGAPDDRPRRGEDRADKKDGEDRGRRGRERRPPPTEEQWEQTKAFLAEHSPQRMAFFERLEQVAAERGGDGDNDRWARVVERVRGHLYERVADLRELREKEPEHFEHALVQYAAEDELMSRLHEARQAERRGDADAAAAARQAAEAVARDYVARAMAEREAGVERMARDLMAERERLGRKQQRLVEERERLDADRQRRGELERRLVERYERYLPPSGDDDDDRGDRPSTRPGD